MRGWVFGRDAESASLPFASNLCANVPKLISEVSFWHFDFGTGFDTQKQPKTSVFNTKKLVSKTLVFETAKLKRRAASFDARGFFS